MSAFRSMACCSFASAARCEWLPNEGEMNLRGGRRISWRASVSTSGAIAPTAAWKRKREQRTTGLARLGPCAAAEHLDRFTNDAQPQTCSLDVGDRAFHMCTEERVEELAACVFRDTESIVRD